MAYIRCWTCCGNGALQDGQRCPDCNGTGCDAKKNRVKLKVFYNQKKITQRHNMELLMEDKMKTLINWLKGNLAVQCPACKSAIDRLENLPDGRHTFILTINKQPEFEIEYSLIIFGTGE